MNTCAYRILINASSCVVTEVYRLTSGIYKNKAFLPYVPSREQLAKMACFTGVANFEIQAKEGRRRYPVVVYQDKQLVPRLEETGSFVSCIEFVLWNVPPGADADALVLPPEEFNDEFEVDSEERLFFFWMRAPSFNREKRPKTTGVYYCIGNTATNSITFFECNRSYCKWIVKKAFLKWKHVIKVKAFQRKRLIRLLKAHSYAPSFLERTYREGGGMYDRYMKRNIGSYRKLLSWMPFYRSLEKIVRDTPDSVVLHMRTEDDTCLFLERLRPVEVSFQLVTMFGVTVKLDETTCNTLIRWFPLLGPKSGKVLQQGQYSKGERTHRKEPYHFTVTDFGSYHALSKHNTCRFRFNGKREDDYNHVIQVGVCLMRETGSKLTLVIANSKKQTARLVDIDRVIARGLIKRWRRFAAASCARPFKKIKLSSF